MSRQFQNRDVLNLPRKVSSTHVRQMSVGASVGTKDAPDGTMNDS